MGPRAYCGDNFETSAVELTLTYRVAQQMYNDEFQVFNNDASIKAIKWVKTAFIVSVHGILHTRMFDMCTLLLHDDLEPAAPRANCVL